MSPTFWDRRLPFPDIDGSQADRLDHIIRGEIGAIQRHSVAVQIKDVPRVHIGPHESDIEIGHGGTVALNGEEGDPHVMALAVGKPLSKLSPLAIRQRDSHGMAARVFTSVATRPLVPSYACRADVV